MTIERRQKVESSALNERESHVLAEVERAIDDREHLVDFYRRIEESILDSIPADRIVIALVDPESDTITREFVSPPAEMENSSDVADELGETLSPIRIDDFAESIGRYPGLAGLVDQGFVCGIYAPLMVGSTFHGVLGVNSSETGAYGDDDLALLALIADGITDPVLNARNRRWSVRETREREILDDISRSANSTRDIESTLDDAFGKLKELLPVDRVSVSVKSGMAGSLNMAYASGAAIALTGDHSSLPTSDDGLRAVVARTGVSRLIGDVDEDLLAEAPGSIRMKDAGLRSAIFTPLTTDGETIGVLSVHCRSRHAYSQRDLALIERLAVQITGAFAFAELSAAVEFLKRQQALLAELGQQIDASAELDDVYAKLGSVVGQLVQCDRFTVVMLDESVDSNTFVERFVWGEELTGYRGGEPIPLAGSITEYVVESKETAAWPSPEWPDERVDQFPVLTAARESGLRTFISTPLIVAEECVGVVHFDGFGGWIPDERDIATAEVISKHVSGALSRLHLLERLDQMAKDEALLAEIGRIASSKSDISDVYGTVATLLSTAVAFDGISIASVDSNDGMLRVRFVEGGVIPGFAPGDELPIERTHTGEVLAAGSPVVLTGSDLESLSAKYPNLAAFVSDHNIRSRLVAPVRNSDVAVGVITLHAENADAFSDRDIDIVRRVGDQISGAMANAELRAELERNAAVEAGLAEIGRVGTASPDFADVFDSVVRSMTRVIDFDRITVARIDTSENVLETRFAHGVTVRGFEPGDRESLSEDVIQQLENLPGGGIIVDITDETDDLLGHPQEFAVEAGLASAMVVTLRSHGELIGNMSIRSKREGAYSQRELDLFRRIGDQLAGALANSDLHSQAERRVREEELLAEISRIVTSSVEFGDVFDSVSDAVSLLIPFDRIAIAEIDVSTGSATTRCVAGIPLIGFEPGDSIDFSDQVEPTESRDNDVERFDSESQLKRGRRVTEEAAVDAGLRSGMSVNLRSHGVLIGNLSLRTRSEIGYGKADLALLQKVGAQIAGAFANSALHEKADRAALEESVLAKISRDVGAMFEPEVTLDRILEDLSQIVPAERATIALANQGANGLEYAYVSGTRVETGSGSDRISPSPEGMSSKVMRSEEPLLINDASQSSDETPGSRNLALSGLRSAIAVPMMWEGRPIGVFGVSSKEANAYNSHHVDLVVRVSNQLSGWVANARLHQGLERQARIESVMAEIARSAASSLDLDEGLVDLVGGLSELLPTDRVMVAVGGPDESGLRPVYTMTRSEQRGGRADKPNQGGFLDYVTHTGEPLLVEDIGALVERHPGSQALIDDGINSAIVVPMIWESEVIGVIGIGASSVGAYSASDVTIVERSAQLLAGAVINADLLRRVEEQAAEQRTLAEIGRVVNSSIEPTETFGKLIDLVQALIPTERIVIATWDPDRKNVLHTVAGGGPAVPLRGTGEEIPFSGSVTEYVLNSKEPFIWSDVDGASEPLPALVPLVEQGLKSTVSVPLTSVDRTVGVLHLARFDEEVFTERDVAVAQSIGAQIAGAVANADLFIKAAEEARQRIALAEIGRLAGSSLDAEELFLRLTPALKRLVPYDRIAISTYDASSDSWLTNFTEGVELPDAEAGAIQRSVTVASRHLLDTRSSILMSDPGDDDGEFHDPRARAAGLNSFVLSPMLESDAVVGAVGIHSREPGTYADRHVQLLEQVAAQISGAFQNATLHARVERQAREQELLAQIGRVINSTVHFDSVFDRFAGLVSELIPSDRIAFASLDPVSESLVVRTCSTSGDNADRVETHSIPLDGSLSGHVLVSMRPFVWSKSAAKEDLATAYPGMAPRIASEMTSLISVPLMVLERPVGVLHLAKFAGPDHTERDAVLAEAVGAQIAGAFANAGLLAQTVREADERAVLAEIGRLVGSTLDLSEIHSGVAEQIARLLPYDRMSLVTIDRQSGTLISLHSTGPQVAGWSEGVVQPLTGTLAEEVVVTGRPVLVHADSSDDLLSRYPAQQSIFEVLTPRSFMAIPLMRRGEVFGVMHLSSETADVYSDTDVQVAERVAGQIAGGVVNADLFARMEAQAVEREHLAEIGRLVGSTLDLDELWPLVTTPIKQLVEYDRLAVVLLDPDSGRRWTEYFDGVEFEGSAVGDTRAETTASSRAMRAGEAVLIRDAADPASDPNLMGPKEIERGFRSKAGVPIIFNAEMVGELDVKSFAPDAYSLAEVERLERIATLIAGAIANARLHAMVVLRAQEEEIISEIGRRVSASLDFGSNFEDLAQAVKRLVPYDRFVIQGADYEANRLWIHFVAGDPIEGWEAGTARDLKVHNDPGLVVEPRMEVSSEDDPSAAAGLREMVIAPLVWEGRAVGNISARSRDEGRFNQHHVSLLARVAQQITGAFVNAELHAVTAQEAEERALLAEIGRVAGGSLDLDEMLESVSVVVKSLLPYDRFAITIRDAESDTWTTRFARGVEVPGYEPGVVHPDSHPPVGIGSGTETKHEARMTSAGLISSVSAEFVVNGTVTGSMAVRSLQPDAYGQKHLELVRKVADQIGGSVTNAELHAITEREAFERAVLADIGRLVSKSLNFGDVFDDLADSLKLLIPFDRFSIMGLDPDKRVLWTHYVAGQEVEGWEAGTSHEIAPWQKGQQLMPLEGILFESTLGDDENETIMASVGLVANASVPLIWEDRAIGALSVRASEIGRLTPHHLQLLGRVGQQIIGTFVNAELHALTEKEAEQRAILAEISRMVGASLDVQEMFETIADPLSKLVPYDRFAVTTFEASSSVWTTRFVKGDPIDGYEIGDQHPSHTPYAQFDIAKDLPTGIIGTGTTPDIPEAVAAGLNTCLTIPLVTNGELIGSISMRSRESDVYTRDHVDLAARIADQIAGNVANSELHRALADVEARTRAVVETAAVGIVTADDTLSMLTVNDAVLDIFGYEREELIGQNVSVLAAEPYRSDHDGYVDRYHKTNEARIIGTYREVEGRRKDGTTFPIELEVTRVDLERGRMYTGVIRDITDRKRAEEELAEMASTLEDRVEQRTEQLQQANSELEAFSYSVSHDLRGPLTMNAHLATRLLESDDDKLSETSRKYVELIARSSTESAALVSDLLNFSRLGQQTLDLRPVEIDTLVDSLRMEFAELHPNVTWEIGDLPGCDADQGLLRAVFSNLISNACKFTTSRPEPSVEVGAISSDDETIYFVKDNGVGFDQSQEQRVFEVFERLHRPEDYQGTGAGLAIVRRIVERHGGKIWAESEVDVGTTFFFTLAR